MAGLDRGASGRLRRQHLARRNDFVQLDRDGSFPDASVVSRRVQPVVVDANWLRNEIGYACRNQRQTVFLTAVNAGALRPFCAPHVVEELLEHHAKWAASSGLEVNEYRRMMFGLYVPLLRIVDPPHGMLTRTEQARMDTLAAVDLDDVPSGTLSVILGAPFISNDRHAHRAVYADDAAPTHADLLSLLRNLSDARLVDDNHKAMADVAAMGLTLIQRGAVTFWRRVPHVAVLLLAAGAWRVTRESRSGVAGLRASAVRVGSAIAEELAFHSDLQRVAHDAAPERPSAPSMAELPREAILLRACFYAMARMSKSAVSVAELSTELPSLPVGQSDTRVRAVLRTAGECTLEVRPGRWQLGRAASRPPP